MTAALFALTPVASPAQGAPSTTAAPRVNWLGMNGDKLAYGRDAQGNRVPDYSYAGYRGGGVPLPAVPARVTVPAPSGQDDTAALQQAIDTASALPPDAQGFRGAVRLGPGRYRIGGTLRVTASGVVIRGSGGATVLAADGARSRTLITFGAKSSYGVVGTPARVTDDYVPVGSGTLTLSSTAGLSVGDAVVVERPTTQAWIDAIGMKGIFTPDWSLRFERRITAISGNRITLDIPLTNALEQQYTQATVYRYTFPRISQVGLENLSADGGAMTAAPDYSSTFYNAALWEFNAVEDSWVSNVVANRFGGAGQTALGPQSRRVSVLRTQMLDMVTTDSSARSNAYLLQGQQNLVQDCRVTATKVHAFTTYGRQAGPNVFSRCTAELVQTTYDSGGHQRWGSGTLYDQLRVDGTLLLVNNGTRGSGHGWSDANSTAYNCVTEGYRIQGPPTAHNWSFGCTGTLLDNSDGEVVSPGKPVLPASLYDQQLADRTS
ncbi:Peptidoglycan-binding LysM (plasmid) [Streptomyces clavuligerus]|uniref:Peptidoglycan-binding LysM n=1 Tax=Streptomyces clavuligerus TaxID=1901 RepID=D5SJT2_STRCL|nr:Peptidoglycan-binding LysM [Streptomyces clavuligerus]